MDDPYIELVNKARAWTQQGVTMGWLPDNTAVTFDRVYEHRTPATLFNPDSQRPLVVAFLGGTGVGKSTLLNRLARKTIAQTGVERPTSRVATLYYHRKVQLRQLPTALPLNTVKCVPHNEDEFSAILWIDMPDIDSIEQENRTQALAWLPHIDVVVYVVSPERYRDNSAWRILLNKTRSHSWIFVINHWDTGVDTQLYNFEQHLTAKGGFQNPFIYRTDCRNHKPADAVDEFETFRTKLLSLAHRHVIDQCDLRGFGLRLQVVQEHLQNSLDKLENTPELKTLTDRWSQIWVWHRRLLVADMRQPIQAIARQFARRETEPDKSFLYQQVGSDSASENNARQLELAIWNPPAQAHLTHALEQFFAAVDKTSMSSQPFQMTLQAIPAQAAGLISSAAENKLLESLISIGFLSQRLLFNLADASMICRPLAALRTEKTAVQGLACGVASGLNELDGKIRAGLAETLAAQTAYCLEGAHLRLLCAKSQLHHDKAISATGS